MGHGIVPDTAGWGTFGWLIAVFVLVKIIFALCLQIIIVRLRRVGKAIDVVFKAARPWSLILQPVRVSRRQ